MKKKEFLRLLDRKIVDINIKADLELLFQLSEEEIYLLLDKKFAYFNSKSIFIFIKNSRNTAYKTNYKMAITKLKSMPEDTSEFLIEILTNRKLIGSTFYEYVVNFSIGYYKDDAILSKILTFINEEIIYDLNSEDFAILMLLIGELNIKNIKEYIDLIGAIDYMENEMKAKILNAATYFKKPTLKLLCEIFYFINNIKGLGETGYKLLNRFYELICNLENDALFEILRSLNIKSDIAFFNYLDEMFEDFKLINFVCYASDAEIKQALSDYDDDSEITPNTVVKIIRKPRPITERKI